MTQGEALRGQDATTTRALAQARDALIGFAATYRDRNPDQAFGYLPCPDTNNDGVAEPNCGAKDETVVGRLPWKTLGLPPLSDGSGECFWYVVSGNAKNNPMTDILNWDTPGLFIVKDAAGTLLAGATPHSSPWAVIIAPGTAVAGQARPSPGGTVCPGSNTASAYLEGLGGLAAPSATLTLATAQSISDGTNNDRGLWISSKDIFDRIKQRSDFKSDIDTLMADLANCLNGLPPAALPPASATNKGVGAFPVPTLIPNEVLSKCKPVPAVKLNTLQNWQDNLLYANPGTANGSPTCKAVLAFSGARTAPQIRADAATKANPENYLEGANVAAFAAGGSLNGQFFFDKTAPTTDLLRCITGLPGGAVQASFANDYASFTPTGGNQAVAANPTEASVDLVGAPGNTGGCFWFGNPVPLAGKTLRTYYEFQFSNADLSALNGGSDRGNGFTLQLVEGDMGLPTSCGTESKMGTLQPVDGWLFSLIVETDVHQDSSSADPAGNHTAIMINGNLNHASSSTMSSACDGSASGCLHSPANKFEEAPLPLPHNQRVEIRSGCNSTCSSCNPASHVTPNTYVNIAAWVDCVDCNNIAADLDRTAHIPTVQRCVSLDASLNTAYAGITSGFLSGSSTTQGVTIRNFAMRSE